MKKKVTTKNIIIIIILLVLAAWLRRAAVAPIAVAIMLYVILSSKKKTGNTDQDEPENEMDNDYTERTDCYRNNNTVITCDYCGSKFDTAEHSTCPHCGGTYYDDEEWKNIRYKRNR